MTPNNASVLAPTAERAPRTANAAPRTGEFAAPIRNVSLFRDCLLAIGAVVQTDFQWKQEDYEEWHDRVIDPVVTIYREGISFEGFSIDGSALGWVHFDDSVFGAPKRREPGCTNIDFSAGLERVLRGLSPIGGASLRIGATEGITLETPAGAHREKRIDLPDDWLLGFGELHAALLQAGLSLELARADLFNILRFLSRRPDVKRERRALVFELAPGRPAQIRFEPWDHVIRLQGRAPDIDEAVEWRVYGRRRLALIESLLPLAQSATVHLAGDSRPSCWELRLPGARFVLGLSSWTSRRFTQSITESLLAARAAVDDATVQRAAVALREAGRLPPGELAAALGIAEPEAVAIGLALCRQGLAIVEPGTRALRWRPMAPFPIAELTARGMPVSREERATALIEDGKLEVGEVVRREGLILASARCRGSVGVYDLSLALNPDGSFASGDCDCPWIRRNGLKGGPCKHLLALRDQALAAMSPGAEASAPNPAKEK